MRLDDLEGRKVGIWGFGREGRAALAALGRLGSARLRVFTPAGEAVEAGGAPAEFVSDTDVVDALGDCDVVIRSPGVSIHSDEVAALRRAGPELTTGTNLWFAEVGDHAPVVVVTGTKGKSTTASLAAHLARSAGVDAQLAGNVGRPLLSLLDEPLASLYVVELSSYQIADLETAPTVGVILNLFPEHLDWHRSEERYYEDKLRLVSGSDEVVPVLNACDPRLSDWGGRREGARWFGDERGTREESGAFVSADGRRLASVADLRLPGAHNLLNACAAFEALEAAGVPAGPEAAAGLRTFRPLSHRLEEVAGGGERVWVNDSISTTPESTIAAIRSYPDRHVTVIVGGFDRGQRYDELARELAEHTPSAAVVALPQTGPRLIEALAARGGATSVRAEPAADLDEGVELAARLTPPTGVVLLSPAAPSYGRYRDFEERGEHFRGLVEARPATG